MGRTVSKLIRRPVYRIGQVARLLGVCRNTVKAWIDDGKLPGSRLGGESRFRERRITHNDLMPFIKHYIGEDAVKQAEAVFELNAASARGESALASSLSPERRYALAKARYKTARTYDDRQRRATLPHAPRPLTVMERTVYETAERIVRNSSGGNGSSSGSPVGIGVINMPYLHRVLSAMGFSQGGIDLSIETLKARRYWTWKELWPKSSPLGPDQLTGRVSVDDLPDSLRATYQAAELLADGHGYLAASDMTDSLGIGFHAYEGRRTKLKALGLWKWHTRRMNNEREESHADSRVSIDEQHQIHAQIKQELMPAGVLFDPINDEVFMSMPVAAFQFPPPPRPQPDWQKKEQSLEEVCRRYIREWKEWKRRGPLPISWPPPTPESESESGVADSGEPIMRGRRMKGCGWGRFLVGKGH